MYFTEAVLKCACDVICSSIKMSGSVCNSTPSPETKHSSGVGSSSGPKMTGTVQIPQPVSFSSARPLDVWTCCRYHCGGRINALNSGDVLGQKGGRVLRRDSNCSSQYV